MESVLAGVPASERCRCREDAGQARRGEEGDGLFGRILARLAGR